LRISWGRAFQVAEAHELRVEDGEIAFGAAQRVDQGVVSFERRFSDGPTLRIEAFDRRMPHPRTRYENTFDPLRVLPELSADRMAIAPIRSRMRGVEMSAQWERGPWSVWSAYTWSKSRDVIDSRWQLRDWDQRSTLATSVAWQHGPWAITVQGAWRSGRPTTPFLDEDLSAPALGLRNSRKFPGHTTIDARVARRFELGAGSLLVYAQVTNLLNGYNQCCTELDLPDEESDPTALEIQSLASYPLVPALGVSYEF
jgi:outer membrane cobalamin receptor